MYIKKILALVQLKDVGDGNFRCLPGSDKQCLEARHWEYNYIIATRVDIN